jgi:hypothetical protein
MLRMLTAVVILVLCSRGATLTALTKPSVVPLTGSVVVRTYTTVSVAAHDLAVARGVVEKILNAHGIAVRWRGCPVTRSQPDAPGPVDRAASPDRCADALGSEEVIVRIAEGSTGTDRRWLGYSFVDTEQKRGSLATVFADRVEQLAINADVDMGTLLGLAMAHELGHLLLGTSAHSRRGLMRGHWRPREVRLQRVTDWLLSSREGTEMRRGLVARGQQPGPPAPAIAEIVDARRLLGPSVR